MAARGRILGSIFLCLSILPLLASAVLPGVGHRGMVFPGHDHDHDDYDHDHQIIGYLKKKGKGYGQDEDDSFPISMKPYKKKGKYDHDDNDHDDDEDEYKNQEPENGKEDPKEHENEEKKPDHGNGGYGGGPEPEKKKNPDEGKDGSHEQDPKTEEPVNDPENGAKQQPASKQEGLREGFYEKSCPQAENVVKETIKKIFHKDPTLAPSFVRLFFHDCFVTGCDASVLLDQTPTGEEVEKKASVNGPFVRGFEAIDEIKAQLETECPGIVSCADILAFANRDSLVHTGVPSYNVAAGRRDSLASLSKNVLANIPVPETPLNQITQMFEKKGFSMEDLVVLTGAHSIGTAHCTVVSGRFFDPERSKDMDQGYVIKMRPLVMCRNETQDLPFDPYSHHKMDSRFYKELLQNRALLESDHNLAKDGNANAIMKKLVDDQKGWLAKFTRAITKMGEIEVLTGDQGQIRKQCRAVN